MRKKRCPKCNLTSFSACKEVWICPYCGENMSDQPDYSINDDTSITIIRDGKHEDRDIALEKLWS